MRNNPVTVHPAVFADQRHVDALQARTGRRIVISQDGRAHLAQPPTPITRLRDRLEDRMRTAINNLADYTFGHDPKGAA